MPSRTLPNYTAREVAANNSRESCWVTIGSDVYDVTDFVDEHPGGEEFILSYGGMDVGDIMKDEIQHTHSENAYGILHDSLIGFVATDPVVIDSSDLPSEEDIYRDTDAKEDYRANKFLDLDRPLLMQVWNGRFDKDFYLEQVHHPRKYKNGGSPPLFGNFLEPLSKTAWWIIPVWWWPWVAYGSWLAYSGMPSGFQFAAYWLTGLALFTLIEYGLHRGLFHIDKYLPNNRVAITTHFLLHGIHHYVPMDRYRLVMPPTLFTVLATPFYKLAHTVFYWDWYVAMAVFCGGIFGYTLYDCTHYFLHHKQLPSFYRQLKSYHFAHHWTDHTNGFGVTSMFWDRVFGTELVMPQSVVKTS